MLVVWAVLAAALSAAAPAPQPADPRAEQQRRMALAHYERGRDALYAERFEEAEHEFAEAIKLDPLLTLGHYGLGQAEMALKRYPEAVQAFTGCREAYRQIATLALKSAGAAEEHRQQEIQILRSDIATLQASPLLTARNQPSIRRLEDRVRDLEYKRTGPDAKFEPPAGVSLALGSAYFRGGSLPDAEREYAAAINANPKLGEAHSNLAVVYMLTARFDQAAREIKLAEKHGFRVDPRFKDDLKRRASPTP